MLLVLDTLEKTNLHVTRSSRSSKYHRDRATKKAQAFDVYAPSSSVMAVNPNRFIRKGEYGVSWEPFGVGIDNITSTLKVAIRRKDCLNSFSNRAFATSNTRCPLSLTLTVGSVGNVGRSHKDDVDGLDTLGDTISCRRGWQTVRVELREYIGSTGIGLSHDWGSSSGAYIFRTIIPGSSTSYSINLRYTDWNWNHGLLPTFSLLANWFYYRGAAIFSESWFEAKTEVTSE